MNCPSCRAALPPASTSCAACGQSFELVCDACQLASPPTAAFCSGCGARLTTLRGRASGAAPARPQSSLLKGERRTITVMLCDLSGYTAMNERLDPEDVADIMALIRSDATRILESFGGIANQFVGDEIVGLFGVPTAKGEEARRAVSAAIELHAQVRRIAERVEKRLGVPPRVHTGIQTGLMVAEKRDQRSGTYELTGDAINTAARLRSLAESDEIVVGEATHRLIEPYFETEAIGPHMVRGKSEAVHAFRVLRERAERSQFDVARDQGLTPWTGRHSELDELERAFAAAARGQGRLVSIEGEAGAGKSRLCHEFLEALPHDAGARSTLVLSGRCEAYGMLVSYQPFIQMVRAAFDVRDGDDGDAVADKIAGGTGALDPALGRIVPVLLHLLSVRSKRFPLPAEMGGEKLPLVIQRALVDLVLAMSVERTVLLYIEDWHWADDASKATLLGLAREITERSALLLVTHRPLPPGAWGDVRAHRVALEPLTPEHTRSMIGHCLGAQSVQAELADKIYERTLGNPFFVEEICSALLQQGGVTVEQTASFVGRIEDIDLPATVQSVVLSRVDALEPRLRDVLRVASVIGRDFAADLLADLVPAELSVGDALGELTRLNFILPLPHGAPGEFRFKHATTQEVTYETLTQRNRARAHQRVAELIEGRAAGKIDDHVEALARHYQRANNDPKAIEFLERAGRKAAARFELGDARRDFLAAIELSGASSDDGAMRKRIALTLSWAALCIFAANRDQLDVVDRARRDAESLGDSRLATHCLYWMTFIHYGIGALNEAEAGTRQALRMAEHLGDDLMRGTALCHLGTILALRRDSIGAERSLQEGMEILDVHSRTERVSVGARYKFAVAIRGLVDVDRGAYTSGNGFLMESIGLVRADGQRSTEASNLVTMAIAATLQGDWPGVISWTAQSHRIAAHLRAPFHLSVGGVLAGYADFRLGERDRGMGAMMRSIQMQQEAGVMLSACLTHACVADAASRAGDWETTLHHAAASLARGACGDLMGDDLAHRALLRYEAHVAPGAVPARIDALCALAKQRGSKREQALADLAAAEAYKLLGQALPFERHASAAARQLEELGPHLVDEAADILRRTTSTGSHS